MTKNKTLVLGASENTDRYSNKAIRSLVSHKQEVIAIGNRPGSVAGVEIVTRPVITDEVDTVTMYLGKPNQAIYYNYILSIHPRRIIFNPGAENRELAQMAEAEGIKVMEACTLVLLATGQY